MPCYDPQSEKSSVEFGLLRLRKIHYSVLSKLPEATVLDFDKHEVTNRNDCISVKLLCRLGRE